MHTAAYCGNLKLVQWLVEHGADINAKTDNGFSVLHAAAITGSLELVQWLVEHGADVKAKDSDGWTVLHAAVNGIPSNSSMDLYEWLINQGIDVNAAANNGETALSIACEVRDDLDLVRFLVEHGADVNPNRGKTFIPYWFEQWRFRTVVKNPFNDPVIRYLMFHDKLFLIGLPGMLLAIIVMIWIIYIYANSKQKKHSENN